MRQGARAVRYNRVPTWPGLGATTSSGRSPHLASGIAITAASATKSRQGRTALLARAAWQAARRQAGAVLNRRLVAQVAAHRPNHGKTCQRVAKWSPLRSAPATLGCPTAMFSICGWGDSQSAATVQPFSKQIGVHAALSLDRAEHTNWRGHCCSTDLNRADPLAPRLDHILAAVSNLQMAHRTEGPTRHSGSAGLSQPAVPAQPAQTPPTETLLLSTLSTPTLAWSPHLHVAQRVDRGHIARVKPAFCVRRRRLAAIIRAEGGGAPHLSQE